MKLYILFALVAVFFSAVLAQPIGEDDAVEADNGVAVVQELSRQRRFTCDKLGWTGNAACNLHCKMKGKSRGTCRGGTCYCS